ncbi:MAG: TlpA disulfide reductase family protein [Thermoanaerobaculia bacterium]|nr:TlpA disulfide reductase family protein [Thermoanaerobaculia bacterium]
MSVPSRRHLDPIASRRAFHSAARSAVAAGLLLLAACGTPEGRPAGAPEAASESPRESLVGEWRGMLISPGGELPFGFAITEAGGALTGEIENGEEVAELSGVSLDGNRVVLSIDWYDATLEAELDPTGESMRGSWQRTSAKGAISRLPFEATKGEAARFRPLAEVGIEPVDDTPLQSVDGVWSAVFVDDDGSEPARGEFRQRGERVLGTFLTPTGDYRFLAGSYERGVLRLSTFDGSHAFLFQARAQPDGTLAGDFWSRDTYHATWTAERVSDNAEILPDGWSEVGLTNDDGLFRFAFESLDGETVSSADERFDGKVVLVNIFGSWCPNCNDEAPLLAAWDERYGEQGLEIVGIAYEFTGDPERDRRQLRRYAERHGINFTLLLGGVSDKRAAAETLPDLTDVVAYPTSVFIGRDGRVAAIYSGFAGPGTGRHHEELVDEMEALLEALLAAAPA